MKLNIKPYQISKQVTGEANGLSAPNARIIYGSPGAYFPGKKICKDRLSETPYPAFPGSIATNLGVYFVELFSESRLLMIPKVQRFIILAFL